MQTLLSPAICSGVSTEAPPYLFNSQFLPLRTLSLSLNPIASPSLSHPKSLRITHRSLQFHSPQPRYGLRTRPSSFFFTSMVASSPISSGYTSPTDESAKIAQVAKRLEETSRHFKRLGSLGLWCQLVCTMVASVLLSFSFTISGMITSRGTFYITATGIAAAFVSMFLSLEYIRLGEKLKRTANQPSKSPPRADVVRRVKNGIALNILGMGASVLGMQAKLGSLVVKALSSTASPYIQPIDVFPPGITPIPAIDMFLFQASANAVLSHFLGIVFSLELLRSVTLPSPKSPKSPKLA